MKRRITIIDGHPDPARDHLVHALAVAYQDGAEGAGHPTRLVRTADLDFRLLRSKADFDEVGPPAPIVGAQEAIAWAEHLVILYPLWLGGMPALLKGFFEQALRPGFAMEPGATPNAFKPGLRGRSARVIVTMGMPAPAYRWYYGAHSLKALKRNILAFVGIKPVRVTLFGMVESARPELTRRRLDRARRLGALAR